MPHPNDPRNGPGSPLDPAGELTPKPALPARGSAFASLPRDDEDDADFDDAARRRSSRRGSGKRVSLLGLLALLGAAAAWALTFKPIDRFDPILVGAGAAAVALLALIASLGGRTKAGLPLLALLAGLGAVGFVYHQSPKAPGTPAGWMQAQIQHYWPAGAPAGSPNAGPGTHTPTVDAPFTGTPTAADPTPGLGAPSTLPGLTGPSPDRIGRGTIFDEAGGASSPHSIAPGGTSPIPPPPAGSTASPLSPNGSAIPPPAVSPNALASQRLAAAVTAQQSAASGVRLAEDAARQRLAADPACKSAQAAIDAADAEVKDLQQKSDPFSPERIAAAQKRRDAQERLNKIRAPLLAADPAVTTARAALARADAELQAARAAAAGKPGVR